MDPFLGEVRVFGFSYAPKGWALCQGQLLNISQNAALYSLLGVAYGGNGTTTFGLPNFQGRLPVACGQGAGLQSWVPGQQGGATTVTLTTAQMPAHAHALQAVAASATTTDPSGAALAQGTIAGSRNGLPYYQSATPDVAMSTSAIGSAGSTQPHDNMMPYLPMNFCIALTGIYPSRP